MTRAYGLAFDLPSELVELYQAKAVTGRNVAAEKGVVGANQPAPL